MDLNAIGATFPIVFIGELPDKTMFASLVLASRGRPLAVWLGASAAFVVHVAIAVSIGVAVFHALPVRGVDALVAGLFLAGAVYAFAIRNQEGEALTKVRGAASWRRTVVTAASVIFVAEWGDLTQILTANLAVRYHDPLAVGIGAAAALLAVAALAVASGVGVLRVLSVRTLRLVMAVVLLGLAGYSAVEAATA